MNSNDNRKYHTLSKVFFLDVLLDQRTRPIFIYAFIMVIVGAVLYHYLEG